MSVPFTLKRGKWFYAVKTDVNGEEKYLMFLNFDRGTEPLIRSVGDLIVRGLNNFVYLPSRSRFVKKFAVRVYREEGKVRVVGVGENKSVSLSLDVRAEVLAPDNDYEDKSYIAGRFVIKGRRKLSNVDGMFAVLYDAFKLNVTGVSHDFRKLVSMVRVLNGGGWVDVLGDFLNDWWGFKEIMDVINAEFRKRGVDGVVRVLWDAGELEYVIDVEVDGKFDQYWIPNLRELSEGDRARNVVFKSFMKFLGRLL